MDPSESDLLLSVNEVIEAFGRVGSTDRDVMLECLLTIISGQRLDIERFGTRGVVFFLSKMMMKWMTTRTGSLALLGSFGRAFQ